MDICWQVTSLESAKCFHPNQLLNTALLSTEFRSDLQKSYQISGKTAMVFCYQNCSDLLWEKIVLVIERNLWNSRLQAENFQNFKITRTIWYSNSERSEQNAFLTWSWRFLRLDRLEQLKFKLEKMSGLRNMQEKLENVTFCLKTILELECPILF